MHKPRFSSVLALLAAVMLTLASCGGGGDQAASGDTDAPAAGSASDAATSAPAAASDAATTVTWGFWGSPEEKASHEKVAQAFMETHPDITIEVWHQPWDDYFTKLKTLWASGDSSQIPDVLFLWPTPSYASTGVLEDLSPYIQKSNYNTDDYWPALLESATYDDKIYGFPRDISVETLYYNKAIFDEAGVDYPTENWTWDDLTAAAQKLSVVEGSGRVTRYGLGMEGGKYALWINQNGGSILDDMRNPSQCTLTEPAALDAITFFAGMMQENLAMGSSDLSQAGGDAAVFQSGQVAMIVQNSSRVSTFNEADMNYDVAVMPLPEGGQRAASAGGAAWVMSAKSDNKDAAWTFLQWLQSTDGGERVYTESGEIFPALESVAKSDAFLQTDAKPANRQAFLTEAENAQVGRFGYFPDWDELSGTIIDPGLEQVWTGQAEPAQAVQQICQQVDSFLQEKGYPKP